VNGDNKECLGSKK